MCRQLSAERFGGTDGFALATAERVGADLASFDQWVRRALKSVDVRLSSALAN